MSNVSATMPVSLTSTKLCSYCNKSDVKLRQCEHCNIIAAKDIVAAIDIIAAKTVKNLKYDDVGY